MGVILKKKKLKVIPHKKSTKVNWQKEEIREKYREDRHPTPHHRKDYKIVDGKRVYKYNRTEKEGYPTGYYKDGKKITKEEAIKLGMGRRKYKSVSFHRNPKYFKIK